MNNDIIKKINTNKIYNIRGIYNDFQNKHNKYNKYDLEYYITNTKRKFPSLGYIATNILSDIYINKPIYLIGFYDIVNKRNNNYHDYPFEFEKYLTNFKHIINFI